jgi:hypothetical protein
LLVLLFFFNPVVRSLRAIQQASELGKVQRKLGWWSSRPHRTKSAARRRVTACC